MNYEREILKLQKQILDLREQNLNLKEEIMNLKNKQNTYYPTTWIYSQETNMKPLFEHKDDGIEYLKYTITA